MNGVIDQAVTNFVGEICFTFMKIQRPALYFIMWLQ